MCFIYETHSGYIYGRKQADVGAKGCGYVCIYFADRGKVKAICICSAQFMCAKLKRLYASEKGIFQSNVWVACILFCVYPFLSTILFYNHKSRHIYVDRYTHTMCALEILPKHSSQSHPNIHKNLAIAYICIYVSADAGDHRTVQV